MLGPDGRGGCWLIGLRGDRLHLLDGVGWRRGGDFAELLGRADDAAVLDVKADLDTAADLPRPPLVPLPSRPHVAAESAPDRWPLPPPLAA